MLIAMDCVQILMHEREWTRVGGQESNREHMLMALANLDHIIIRALYSPNTTESSGVFLCSVHCTVCTVQKIGIKRLIYDQQLFFLRIFKFIYLELDKK